ncbi:MAG: hypothetical protein KJ814_08915, partial [Proteobacteria bacterium]|nr:hypothetical protein [Pseudomonadota bacterium]
LILRKRSDVPTTSKFIIKEQGDSCQSLLGGIISVKGAGRGGNNENKDYGAEDEKDNNRRLRRSFKSISG